MMVGNLWQQEHKALITQLRKWREVSSCTILDFSFFFLSNDPSLLDDTVHIQKSISLLSLTSLRTPSIGPERCVSEIILP